MWSTRLGVGTIFGMIVSLAPSLIRGVKLQPAGGGGGGRRSRMRERRVEDLPSTEEMERGLLGDGWVMGGGGG